MKEEKTKWVMNKLAVISLLLMIFGAIIIVSVLGWTAFWGIFIYGLGDGLRASIVSEDKTNTKIRQVTDLFHQLLDALMEKK